MRNRRAVIYDNDGTVLNMLRDFFTLRDYDVLTYREPAYCPLDGNDECSNLDPCADIVLSACRMPGQTGIDMLKAQSNQGCMVPVENRALIAGFLNEGELTSLNELGCRFFQKPFLFSDLSGWLDEREQHMDLSRPLGLVRREGRRAGNEAVTCRTRAGEKVLTGVAVNTSSAGLCLKLDGPLRRGETLKITSGSPRPSRDASVRWVRDIGNGSYMAGLRYVESPKPFSPRNPAMEQ